VILVHEGEEPLSLDELPELADEVETLEVIEGVHEEFLAAVMAEGMPRAHRMRRNGSGYAPRPRSGPVDEAGPRLYGDLQGGWS